VDYAVRAMVELAVRSPSRQSPPTKGELLGRSQHIPTKYLESLLAELRRAGLVASRRGAEGGYWLGRPPGRISVADVIRAVEGPLADVRGEAPEDLEYLGAARPLEQVWLATRVALRRVLEEVSLADLLAGDLPAEVRELLADPDAHQRR
jgi:Rrf2 family protein